MLNKNRPSEELIIKQGQICLTREDFWSLGLSQYMESNVRMLSVLIYCTKNKFLDNAQCYTWQLSQGCNHSAIHFRSEMPASRLWKKLHEDMYFILLSSLVLIWMYACLITYVLSLRGKMFTLWTSMLFPPGKTKMWTQCIVCL